MHRLHVELWDIVFEYIFAARGALLRSIREYACAQLVSREWRHTAMRNHHMSTVAAYCTRIYAAVHSVTANPNCISATFAPGTNGVNCIFMYCGPAPMPVRSREIMISNIRVFVNPEEPLSRNDDFAHCILALRAVRTIADKYGNDTLLPDLKHKYSDGVGVTFWC